MYEIRKIALKPNKIRDCFLITTAIFTVLIYLNTFDDDRKSVLWSRS